MDKNQNIKNKQRLSADGNRCSLLPSALRPRLLGVTLILQIVAMSTIFAFPCSTSATSLQMTLPSKISLNANPYNNSGFSENDPVDININTDSKRGYVFSIKSKDDNYLKNGEHRLNPITQSYATGEEFRDSAEPDTWGIKLSKWNSEDNDKYTPLPDGEAVIDQALDTSGSTEHVYQLALATKISPETPAGEYANTFVLSAMSNTTHYSIVYDLNTGKGGPASLYQDGDTAEDTVQLDGGTPTRDDYEFLGWCDEDTIDSSCTGNIYQPGDPFPKNGTLASIDEKVILRAIWKEDVPTTMQEFGDYCSKMTKHQTLTLKDIRDNNEYTITKLKDDKCWMTQNLRLGDNKPLTLTPSDTDTSKTFILPAYTIDAHKSTTSEAEVYRDSNYWQSRQYGYYYNFYASTLGTGIGIQNGSQATDSICPKGWKLPAISDFNNIIYFYNGNALSQPLNFVLAGLAHGATTIRQESNGEYISNTRGDQPTNDMMWVHDNGSMVVGSDCSEDCGFSVRCVSGSD